MRPRRSITSVTRASVALSALAIGVIAFGCALGSARVVHTSTAPLASTLRLTIVAGARQRAHAFAASTGPGYETEFAQSLVVRVDGQRAALSGKRKLRFACLEAACRFAAAVEGDDVSRVDPRSYDVDVVDGRATLPLTLSTDAIGATYTVRVRARVRNGERANEVSFRLEVR